MPGWRAGFLVLLLAVWPALGQSDAIDLKGTWRVALDPDDVGVDEGWFERELANPIELPGTLRDSGYGDPITAQTQWMSQSHDPLWYLRKEYKAYAQPGNVKVPFGFQPKRKYTGVAWYQRTVAIPEDWLGRRCVVSFERVHWASMLWLDDRLVGYSDSLATPHVYDLGVVESGEHRLTVRVDNRYLLPIGKDAHAISDLTQSNWHGLVGALTLSATTPVWIADARIYPGITRKTLRVEVEIGNVTALPGKGTLHAGQQSVPVSWDAAGGVAQAEFPLGGDVRLWDEFDPALYQVTLRLQGDDADDRCSLPVGLRRMESRDGAFYINGRQTFFRGTTDCCVFPLTGYPPTDVASWKQRFSACKDFGLNHVRFHSWCPPEAAFVAADEMGIYLQPECSNAGRYAPGDDVMKDFLDRETQHIVRAYGNHPSFVMLSSGHEPTGSWRETLTSWLREWKQKDDRRLYVSQTGCFDGDRPGSTDESDYRVADCIGAVRLQGDSGWFGRDYRVALDRADCPVIAHQTGQWCAYPDFDEIGRYTGSLKPKYLEIFRDSLAAHGMLNQARDFVTISGRFQLECTKQEIEALLRTPGIGGFQLFGLRDYPGRGVAPVGVLNALGQSKGYALPRQFRRFCNVTVPLARMAKVVYTTDDDLEVDFEIAHFGRAPLTDVTPVMKIVDRKGKVVVSGELPKANVPLGTAIPLKSVSASLSAFSAPEKYRLVLGLKGLFSVENDWEFWVYPSDVSTEAPGDVLVTRSFDEAELRLGEGGKVLFLPAGDQLGWESPPVDKLLISWNRLAKPAWARSLGLLCDPNHPALADFVTDAYYDWQWQDVITPSCRAINMAPLPGHLKPIVRIIDDWKRNDKLGLVFEARVRKGKLIVCSADLSTDLDRRPVARQLRRSLLRYMTTDAFAPTVQITPAQIRSLLFDTHVMQRLVAVAEATGDAGSDHGSEKAIDGDPNTSWLLGGGPDREEKHPCALTIRFPKAVAMKGILCMARQDHWAHEGDICEYVIEVSDDGRQWAELQRGQFESTFEPQKVWFDKTVTTRHLKLRALSGFGDDPVCALAELAVLKVEAGDEGPANGAAP